MTIPTPPGGPLLPDTRYATSITLDGVEMLRAAWAILDPRLFLAEAPQRGQDRVIPGGSGVIAYPRRRTVRVFTTELAVVGYVQPDGTPTAVDPVRQLEANLKYLEDNVIAPVDPLVVPDGTRVCVVTLPDATTVSGTVHVTAMEPKDQAGPVEVRVLSIDIPDGKLF